MDMTSKGIPPSRSHFNALIISCAKDGLAETARAVFEMLPHYDILPELDTWTSLMSCHRKDLEQCKRILDEMLQAGVSPSLSDFVLLSEVPVSVLEAQQDDTI